MIKKENFTFEDFIRFNGMVLVIEICAGLQAMKKSGDGSVIEPKTP